MTSLPHLPSLKQPDFLRREEPLAEYRFGGYHPVNIGDVLNDRYRIERKLGWGEYSTVWLGMDNRTGGFCSIKILTGMASFTSKLHELEFLQHAGKHDPSHPGYSRVVRLLDHFRHLGPYGNHLCLVTELLGESVKSLAAYSSLNNIHPIVVKPIVRDVLLGLDSLHKSGIIHTDLKLDNFLIELEDTDLYVRQILESTSPECYPETQAADGRTIRYVASSPIAIPFEDVQSYKQVRVKIIDLGVACWASKVADNFTEMIQPVAIRAPEVYVGAGWDSKCDIWSLGLLLIEMLRGRPPVPAKDEGDATSEVKVFFLLCLFGKFPIELLRRGKYSGKYFLPDGSFLYDIPQEEITVPKWTEFLKGYKRVLHPDEYNDLVSFLESALKLCPDDRWTAAQLLEHAWVNSETRLLDV